MERINLDFWDPKSLILGLCKIYNVEEEFVLIASRQEKSAVFFLENNGIQPDLFKLPMSHIYIRGKIIGRYIDNFDSLHKFGLLPVTKLLMKDSPIRSFLRDYDIELNVDAGYISYKGIKYYIPQGEECNLCPYVKGKCPYQFSYGSCDFYEKMDFLSTRLYHDKGEIEAFYCADDNSMMEYSTVKRYPEILLTINDVIEAIDGKDLGLGERWEALPGKAGVVSFYAALDSISYINGFTEQNSEILEFEGLWSDTYQSTNTHPQCLYWNIWLLRHALYVIAGNRFSDYCFGVKNNTAMPGRELTITYI